MHKINIFVFVLFASCLTLGNCRSAESAPSNQTLQDWEQRRNELIKIIANPRGGGTILDAKYVVNEIQTTWYAAHFYCVSNGWKLLSVHSAWEQINVEGFLRYYGLQGRNYWTAGTRLGDLVTWRWGVDGSGFNYTNWAAGEPNNARGNEYCMNLNANSLQWNDNSCDIGYHFICEKY